MANSTGRQKVRERGANGKLGGQRLGDNYKMGADAIFITGWLIGQSMGFSVKEGMAANIGKMVD